MSLVGSALGVLLLSGFLSLEPVTYQQIVKAQADAGCSLISETASGVPSPVGSAGRPAGVLDSGQMNFDAGAPLDGTNKACVKTTSGTRPIGIDSASVTGRFLEGWAWNTNLGYVSLSCQSGLNKEIGCGSENYGAVYNPDDGGADGRVRGFAWGDNIGWISMGCDSGYNLGTDCGGIDYGVKIAQSNGETSCQKPGDSKSMPVSRGDLYGHAWSKSVGWINFCGAHVNLAPVISARLSIGPAAGPIYANGNDSYKLIVRIYEDEDPVTNEAAHTLTDVRLNWRAQPRADQITECGRPPDDSCIYNGAILPSWTSFSWSAADAGYVANVKAIAPTGTSDADSLILGSADFVTIDGSLYPLSAPSLPYPFVFQPAVQITRISSQLSEGSITAIPNTPTEVTFTAENNFEASDPVSNINIYSQLYDCSSEYNFNFSPPPADATDFPAISGICRTGIAEITGTDQQAFEETFVRNIDTRVQSEAIISSPESTRALGIQTIIDYQIAVGGTPTSVRFRSASVKDGSVLNQAADVRGNVRIDIRDFSSILADRIGLSLGERAQSKREIFYRAIKSLVRNPAGVTSDENFVFPLISSSAGSKIYYYKKGTSLTSPCKIIIGDSAQPLGMDLSFTGNVTVVSEGCDIYIDQNIRSLTGRLGIIALEDFSIADERKGGNLYICSKVTDVEANIVLDGSLMSYGADSANCGDKDTQINPTSGYPSMTSPRNTLRNQLAIVGSLISNNTYGGSLRTPAILGDGRTTENVNDARWHDINFLRYARTEGICWNSSSLLSKNLSPPVPGNTLILSTGEICEMNNPDLTGIVNIIYRAPSNSLPIFNAVKQR